MAAKSNIVDWKTITNFVVDAFKGYGIPEDDAKICADVLLESDKRGIESHGVNRFKPIYIDRIKAGIQNPVTEFEIVKETPATAVVDGHDGMGQVVGYKAMSMAIEKAKKFGIGMVAARNSCHYGIVPQWRPKRGALALPVQMRGHPSRRPLVWRTCWAQTRLHLVCRLMRSSHL